MGAWTGIGNVLTVTVTGLTDGTGYDFEVRAYDSAGNGPAASMVSATPHGCARRAGSPERLPHRRLGHAHSWSAPSGNGNAVTGYQYQHYEIRRHRAHLLDRTPAMSRP